MSWTIIKDITNPNDLSIRLDITKDKRFSFFLSNTKELYKNNKILCEELDIVEILYIKAILLNTINNYYRS